MYNLMDYFEDIDNSNLLARVNKTEPFYIFANTHVTNDRLVFYGLSCLYRLFKTPTYFGYCIYNSENSNNSSIYKYYITS